MSDFDRDAYRAARTRTLTERVAALERYRGDLERVLAIVLRAAAAATDVDPVELLTAAEDLAREAARQLELDPGEEPDREQVAA